MVGTQRSATRPLQTKPLILPTRLPGHREDAPCVCTEVRSEVCAHNFLQPASSLPASLAPLTPAGRGMGGPDGGAPALSQEQGRDPWPPPH